MKHTKGACFAKWILSSRQRPATPSGGLANRNHGFHSLALLLLLSPIGCQGGVESKSLPAATLQEEIRIGSVNDPDLSLSKVGGVAVYGDTLVLVLQTFENAVRLFDWSGNPVGRIGRGGSGPGEFRRPAGISVIGDTVLVRDNGSNSLAFLSVEGEEMGRVSFPSIVVGEGTGVIRGPSGLFPDGTYLGTVTAFQPSAFQPGSTVDLPMLRIAETGETIDTLSIISMAVGSVIQAPEIGLPYIILPVRDIPLTAAAPQLGMVVVADPFPSGHPGSFRVTTVYFTGDTLFSRLYPFTPLRIEGELKESLVQKALPEERQSARVRALILKGLEAYPYLTPVSSLAVDVDGRIWVGREEAPSKPVGWDVFDPSGEGLFRVTLPPDSRFAWASANILFTVEQDSLDVPYVVRYRLSVPR